MNALKKGSTVYYSFSPDTTWYAPHVIDTVTGFTRNDVDVFCVVTSRGYVLPANRVDVMDAAALDAYADWKSETDAQAAFDNRHDTSEIDNRDEAYFQGRF